MTRTVARQLAVQIGFSVAGDPKNAQEALDAFFDKDYFSSLADENELFAEFPDEKQQAYISTVVLGTAEHAREMDAYVEKYARGWKVSRISRIALTILRTALFEVLYLDEVPDSVAINEAVELAKSYEEPETVSFINGILGSFMRGELGAPPKPEREPENMSAEAEAEALAEPEAPAEVEAPAEPEAPAEVEAPAEAEAPESPEQV